MPVCSSQLMLIWFPAIFNEVMSHEIIKFKTVIYKGFLNIFWISQMQGVREYQGVHYPTVPPQQSQLYFFHLFFIVVKKIHFNTTTLQPCTYRKRN